MSASALSTVSALRLGLQPGQLDGGEIRQRDLRQQFQLDLEFKVGGRAGVGSADQVDLRLAGGAQAALGEHLLGRVADALLQHLGGHRGAVALAHDGSRHLAGAEPGQAQGPAEIGQPRGAAALDVGGRHDDGEAALQPSERVSVTCMVGKSLILTTDDQRRSAAGGAGGGT